MPFELAHSGSWLRLTLSGHVSVEDLLAAAAAVDALEARTAPAPHRITDLSQVTDFGLTTSEMRTIVSRRLLKTFANGFKSAIVAPEVLHVGYARMFQILNDHPQITIEVFRTRDEAERWLGAG